MRWVLDTNVAISALVWRGTPYRLLQAIRRQPETLQIYSSEALLTELANVLARPHLRERLTAVGKMPAEVLADYAAAVEIVAPTTVPRVVATARIDCPCFVPIAIIARCSADRCR